MSKFVPVYIDSSSHLLESSDDGRHGQYIGWYTKSEFNVNFATAMEMTRQHSDVFYQDVEIGDYLYVLYCVYSDGDSFGSSTGNGDVIWCFKDKELALKAKQVMIDNSDGKKEHVELETEHGTLVLPNLFYNWFVGCEGVYLKQFKYDDVFYEGELI